MFPLAADRKGAKGTRASGADSLLARAPKLRESADQMIAAIVKGLQVMAGPTTRIEGTVAGFALDRAKAVAAAQKPETAVGAIDLPDLGGAVLATLSPTLVHGIVELLCGGNGVEPPPATSRPVTAIDAQFAQTVVALAAAALQSECAELGLGKARATKVEMPVSDSVFGSNVDEVGIVTLTIGIFGQHGVLRLALPPKALALFADATPARPDTEAADPAWASRLREELARAPVALAAYLDAKDISLGVLAGLKAGQILALPQDARGRAALMSDGRVLFRGEIGQEDNRFSLRIGEVIATADSVALMAGRRAPYFEAFQA